ARDARGRGSVARLRLHPSDGSVPKVTSQEVALYLHIPYCLAKCPYCDFNSYAARAWPEEEYAGALIAELAHRVREEPFAGATVTSICSGCAPRPLLAPPTCARLLRDVR